MREVPEVCLIVIASSQTSYILLWIWRVLVSIYEVSPRNTRGPRYKNLWRDTFCTSLTKPEKKVEHTQTVDTLSLVCADDNATESCTFFKQENSIGVATLSLTFASTRATVVTGVGLRGRKCLASWNGNSFAQGRSCWGCRKNVGRCTAL